MHWLPVEQRIIFKILMLTFKVLNNFCPSYIRDLLKACKPTTISRSSSRNLLVIPRSKLKSYGDRAFSVSALTLCVMFKGSFTLIVFTVRLATSFPATLSLC